MHAGEFEYLCDYQNNYRPKIIALSSFQHFFGVRIIGIQINSVATLSGLFPAKLGVALHKFLSVELFSLYNIFRATNTLLKLLKV